MADNDNGKVTIGVGLSPLVISERTAKVGEPVILTLITGLTPPGIIWRSNGHDVPVMENCTVTFDEPGTYIPVIMGYPQHISYSITVTE